MEILAVMFIYWMIFYALWLAIVWLFKLPFRIFKWIFGSGQEETKKTHIIDYYGDIDDNYRKRSVGNIRRDQ